MPEIRVSNRDGEEHKQEDGEDLEFQGDPVHQPQDDKIVEPDDIDLADERHDLSDSYAGIVQRGSNPAKEEFMGHVEARDAPFAERERIRSFVNSEIYQEDDEKISYLKLKRHIQLNHPTDNDGQRYSICSEIGYLPCCHGCFRRKYNTSKRKDEIEVTRIQQ